MKESKIEYFVWVDKLVDDLKAKQKNHMIHGGWTPSGYFHIGNSRAELLIPGLVHKQLIAEGIDATHQFIIDDFDDFDKIPAGLDIKKEDFEPHLGKPLREIPSPVEGHASWAAYFTSLVTNAIGEFGLTPNVISSYDSYKSGRYDEAIKIVLDKAEQVREIWNDVTNASKQKGWLPIMVRCEKCNKLSTTKAIAWDGNEVEYLCTQNTTYAKGCRHKGTVRPVKGNAKLPWRLHWPATWFIHGTTFETGGKDHFAAGGSVVSARRFIKEIFGKDAPYQIRSEFLLVDNAKLSGSSGNTISLNDWLRFAEPELLRFMMISYNPESVINFDLHSNKFTLLADRYDEAERVFFGKEGKGEKRDAQLKRYYELAQPGDVRKQFPVQLAYNIAVIITQTFPDKSLRELINILHKKGWIASTELSKEDEARMTKRLQLAKYWVDTYAPDEVKFTVQETVPEGISLTDAQQNALHEIAAVLEEQDMDDQSLFEAFYEVCKKNEIKNTEFFKAAYNVLLNKDRGPRLAPFILTIGKDKVVKLFKAA